MQRDGSEGEHDEPDALAEARRIAWLLDEAVRLPGGIRFGLDGVLGLIPGIGDLLCLLAAGRIVEIARRQSVPLGVLARMVGNIGIDALVGAIPIIGDLFDFGFKANARNVDLLEQALRRQPGGPRRIADTSRGADGDADADSRHSGDAS
jgi:hypothetical protein